MISNSIAGNQKIIHPPSGAQNRNMGEQTNSDSAATGFCNELGGSYNHGLTKRELIAAMAMQGMLAAGYGDFNDVHKTYIAELAIKQADELLIKLSENG